MIQQPLHCFPVRVDLHCHSCASSEAGEAVLGAIDCPESFSEPREVYDQALRRDMDFVTITDHDSIEGVAKIADRNDVLLGEELTCFFPEDRCKMHVLVWGIDAKHHDALQARAADLYEVATYVEEHQLAHAVAHPIYRQNDLLERWHVERLLLLFKGFECLNGSHSLLHRQAFEPLLDELTPSRIDQLSRKHGLRPHWREPWIKARTGGSDDHGLFNIGRTWTEFPNGTDSIEKLLQCIRDGLCRPGGQAGSSLKLAHNFYSVGIRYFGRRMVRKPNATSKVLAALVGERRLKKRDLLKMVVKNSMKAMGRKFRGVKRRHSEPAGVAMLSQLFAKSLKNRLPLHPPLLQAIRQGDAPLSEHQEMFNLICGVDTDVTHGILDSIGRAAHNGRIAPMFDALSAIACQQFMLMPYYFALFHQNRERHLFNRITGHGPRSDRQALKVGVFTDTFEEMNGVSRFLQTLGRESIRQQRSLTIHTCSPATSIDLACRKNFEPVFSCPLPAYPQISLSLPSIVQVLQWVDQQQFDAIHVHTPGPMGLCGVLSSAMLHVPLLATYHTDFPAYVFKHTGDHRLTVAAQSYMTWFYGRADRVLSRSRHYQNLLGAMGIPDGRVSTIPPCVDCQTFHPMHRDPAYWNTRGINAAHKLLYCGRISAEKNLDLLAGAFRQLCGRRNDVALVLAGDGPQMPALRSQLKDLPAYFLGQQNDSQLAPLYANCDLLLFPSMTDTLGQVVLEAQASGLPVLVSDQGGPREMTDDGLTGLVLSGNDAQAWTIAIDQLLDDEPRRQRMSRTAPLRVARCSTARTFESYWEEHVRSARQAAERHAAAAAPPPASVRADSTDLDELATNTASL